MRPITARLDSILDRLAAIRALPIAANLALEEAAALLADFEATMSREEAAAVLGVSPSASAGEVKKAHAQKILSTHPDQGGKTEDAAKLNVARDILLGKRPAGPGGGSRPGSGSGYADYGSGDYYGSSSKPVVETVTWEDAMATARIPKGVTWTFKSKTAYGGGGDRLTSTTILGGMQATGDIVLVLVEHLNAGNPVTRDQANVWTMAFGRVTTVAQVERAAAAMMKKAQYARTLKLWQKLPQPAQFAPFLITGAAGRPVPFANLLVELGLAPAGSAKVGKLDVTLELGGDYTQPSGTLIINHEQVPISIDDVKKMEKARILNAIFGTYWSIDSKKNLTRIDKTKMAKVFEWMVKNISLPESAKALLAQAAGIPVTQAKPSPAPIDFGASASVVEAATAGDAAALRQLPDLLKLERMGHDDPKHLRRYAAQAREQAATLGPKAREAFETRAAQLEELALIEDPFSRMYAMNPMDSERVSFFESTRDIEVESAQRAIAFLKKYGQKSVPAPMRFG